MISPQFKLMSQIIYLAYFLPSLLIGEWVEGMAEAGRERLEEEIKERPWFKHSFPFMVPRALSIPFTLLPSLGSLCEEESAVM